MGGLSSASDRKSYLTKDVVEAGLSTSVWRPNARVCSAAGEQRGFREDIYFCCFLFLAFVRFILLRFLSLLLLFFFNSPLSMLVSIRNTVVILLVNVLLFMSLDLILNFASSLQSEF